MNVQQEGEENTNTKDYESSEEEESFKYVGDSQYFTGLPFANLKITFHILPQQFGIVPLKQIDDHEIV